MKIAARKKERSIQVIYFSYCSSNSPKTQYVFYKNHFIDQITSLVKLSISFITRLNLGRTKGEG